MQIPYDICGAGSLPDQDEFYRLDKEYETYSEIWLGILKDLYESTSLIKEDDDLVIALLSLRCIANDLLETMNILIQCKNSGLEVTDFASTCPQVLSLQNNDYKRLFSDRLEMPSLRYRLSLWKASLKGSTVKYQPGQREYCEEHNITPLEVKPFIFYRNYSKSDHLIDSFIKEFMQRVSLYQNKYAFAFPQAFLRQAEQKIRLFIKDAAAVVRKYDSIIRSINKTGNQALIIKGPEFPVNRIKSYICQRHGFNVISSIHGFTPGIQKMAIGNMELEIGNLIIAPSNESAELLKKENELNKAWHHPYLTQNKKIKTAKHENYHEVFDKATEADSVNSGKVFVVDSLVPGRYGVHAPASCWKTLAKLQIDISSSFTKGSIDFYLKLRPRCPHTNLFKKYYPQMITDKFEDVIEGADALVFPYTATTTFGYSLLTSKRIIIFQHQLECYWPEVRPLLEKRCIVIPSEFDGINPVQYETEALLEAVNRPYEEINYEIVQKYFLMD